MDTGRSRKAFSFTIIKLLISTTTFIFLAGISLWTQADDCPMSTSLPPKAKSYPGLSQYELNQDDGYFIASLDNGDQVMIYFSPCDLALRGHYFVKDATTDIKLINLSKIFLEHMLPGEESKKEVLASYEKMLTKMDIQTLSQNGVEIPGKNELHRLSVSPAKSVLFTHELHYEWIPPLH